MEKRRFRYFRLFSCSLLSLCALALFSSLQAEVKEVLVDVEVPIKGGDLASAIKAAQAEAFKKSVAQSLPSGLSEDERASRIKRAANYIKSFRTLRQEEKSGKLFASFSCEVLVDAGGGGISRSDEDYQDRFALEFVWKDRAKVLQISSLRQVLKEEFKATVRTMKLQKGSAWIELSAPQAPESIYARLSSRYRQQAEIRLIKDVEGIFTNSEYNEFDRQIFEQSSP